MADGTIERTVSSNSGAKSNSPGVAGPKEVTEYSEVLDSMAKLIRQRYSTKEAIVMIASKSNSWGYWFLYDGLGSSQPRRYPFRC